MSGELRYISKRLVQDLIQRWESAPHEERTDEFQPVQGSPIELPTEGNPYKEAQAAEAAAQALNLTATVDDEPVDEGKPYVLAPNAPVRLWVFKAKGEYRAATTAFVSIRQGQRLLVLLGSPSNVVGFSDILPMDGWVPSEAAGLRDVIRRLKDDHGDDDLGALPWPETIETAADFAVNITTTADYQGFAHVLARVYAEAPNIRAIHRTSARRAASDFTRVLVGAPVFVRET
jgi:hypothetical protein